jgi:hypothetical protein
LTLALGLLLAASPACAEGWSLTSWLPGKKESTTTRSSTMRMPMLGGKPLHSTSKSAARQPSVWQRVTTSTRKMATSTKNALTFGDEKEPSRGRHTSWDDQPKARISKKQKDEPSFWARLFQPDEPRPSKTVPDFLSQERPEKLW